MFKTKCIKEITEITTNNWKFLNCLQSQMKISFNGSNFAKFFLFTYNNRFWTA